MTKEDKINKWISENYKWIRNEIGTNITKGRMAGYTDDLVQEMMLSLYNLSEEKLDGMLENGKLKWWVLSGAGLQIRSNTSPFWQTHRKDKQWSREPGIPGSAENIFDRGEVYEEYDESLYQCFKREMDNLHWYLKTLVEKYWYQGYTLDDLHAKYGISKRHITKDLNKALLTIRDL